MSWRTENSGARLRVVVTRDLPGKRWRDILGQAGCETHVWCGEPALTRQEIIAALGQRCDGVIGQLTERWDAELFGALQRAGGRAYSNYAVGYDNVHVEEATRRGIAVGNTPGVLTETTAELAVALTFAAARRIPESELYLRQGRFHGWLPSLFLGKLLWGGTLGIIGAGRIGARYARMLAPGHAMDVVYWDRVRAAELEDFFARHADLARATGERACTCRRVERVEDLLAASDVVSVHLSLDDSTRRLLNAERLALMKKDAVLVNTSRGGVIDEAALVAHLRANPEFRAALDVFEREPELAPGLADLPNAVIVPHIGSATVWTREGMAALAAANVAGVLLGRPVSRSLDVHEFLAGPMPSRTPSIINRESLGLAAE